MGFVGILVWVGNSWVVSFNFNLLFFVMSKDSDLEWVGWGWSVMKFFNN